MLSRGAKGAVKSWPEARAELASFEATLVRPTLTPAVREGFPLNGRPVPSRRSPADPAFTLTTPGPIHRIRVFASQTVGKSTLWIATIGVRWVGSVSAAEGRPNRKAALFGRHLVSSSGRLREAFPNASLSLHFPFTIGDIYQN